MPRVKKLDLGMTALDELFMNDKERAENKLPKIFDIPLSEIDDFPDHPYRVLDDEDMQNLMESIRDRGVITPAMVRKKDDGRYEMISGHRRKHASERLGLETLRCEVVEVSRDEAIILMVDSNAQRSEILPCDKGRAYKMKLDAIKRLPGRPSKDNLCPVGTNLSNDRPNRSDAELAENCDDSARQIHRYIRLTYLVPELQEFVDKGQMKMRPAVELSYLDEETQRDIVDRITVSHKTVDEMAAQYGFSQEQKDYLAELLQEENNSLWASVLYGIGYSDDQIVTVALSQVGNVGGEPYWSWYGFDSRVEWCACFVSWCANECGYIDTGIIPKYAGCVNGVQWFKERGQWLDGSNEPTPGMIIFFDWDSPNGESGPQDGQSDHTGIVQKVENGIVYTVEGNSGDSCRINQYPVGHYEILGYGMPQY